MIALLLAGAMLYPVFSKMTFAGNPPLTGLVIGLVFSITHAAISLSTQSWGNAAVLSTSTGLVLYASYLGGPVSAVIVATAASLLRHYFNGIPIPVGAFAPTLLAISGLLLRRMSRPEDWPGLCWRMLPKAVAAFMLSTCIAIGLILVFGIIENPQTLYDIFLPYLLLGSLGVSVTFLVIRASAQLAAIARENETRLRQLQFIFETCGIGVFRYDGAKGRVDFDENFSALYGTDTEALQPTRFSDNQVHPEDRAKMRAYIQDEVNGTASQGSQVFRSFSPDGRLRHMRSFWKLESLTPDGERNIIGLHMDVSDVIAAREEGSERQRQLAAIAENLPGVIFQLIWQDGKAGEMLFISPKCAEIWGVGPQELLEDPMRLLPCFEEGEEVQMIAAVNESVAAGGRSSARAWMYDAAGERMAVELQVEATPRGDGSHLVNGIYLDITKEIQAEAEARRQGELAQQFQKTEALGQLTGGIAHDFNNILAVILGNLELLHDQVRDPGDHELIDAAIQASQRGAGLTRSMLAFAGRTRLEPEVLDINVVVREARNWMGRALPESVEVETSLLAGLWPVRVDATSLESALLNLILNARDAMDGHGRLTIETSNQRIDQEYVDSRGEQIAAGRYVMLAVSDTGSGIDPATAARIFEPFYTTKPPGSGSGVGLSMVQGFMRQSHGTVHLYTEPGHGTTFKLYFPATDASAAAGDEPAPEAPHAPADGKRILLVEDEDSVRTVLLSMLEAAGYSVVVAKNGDNAFDIFRTQPEFDLIVTDIVMPGQLQGTHLARRIRETKPEARFIFMSGYASEASVHGNGLRPEDMRLMKPVPRAELLQAVADALSD
ncbi:ATP-binding protein [Poseidonocella sedimentorum]|nr:ATP-binding protein [Poseidonocella sedimentorum]